MKRAIGCVLFCFACTSNSELHKQYPILVEATQERRLEWFQDGMTRAESGADSIKYFPDKLLVYFDGMTDQFDGTVSVDTTLSVSSEIGKRYDKAHTPVVYRNYIEPSGLAGDKLTVTDTDETYNCDSIYDYGNKLTAFYRSGRTLTLTSFSKSEVIQFTVTKAPKS